MEKLAGALLAIFYLSGRFSLSGSEDRTAREILLYDVRVWLLFALAAVALVYSPTKSLLANRRLSVLQGIPAAYAMLLPLYVLCSFLWSADLELATVKFIDAAILTIACGCLLPFVRVGRMPAVRHSFWVWIVITTGIMCLLACASFDSSRMSVLGGGPNVFGRNMGLLFLGALYMQRRGSSLKTWRWYPVMAAALLMVLLSGSRGALLGVSVGVFIYMLIDTRFRTRNVMAVGALAIVAQILLLTTGIGAQAWEMFETRVLNLTLEQRYMSGRDDLFALAYELGCERPIFGQGLAGFTIILGRNYPHNTVLELFCETGIIGVLLLFGLLIAVGSHVLRNRRHCDPAIWGAFGLTLSAAMFSGDFFDSRGIYLMALLGSQEFIARRHAVSATPARRPTIAGFPIPNIHIAQPPSTSYSPAALPQK